jgi:hypothetical protein
MAGGNGDVSGGSAGARAPGEGATRGASSIGGSGTLVPHAASIPTIAATPRKRRMLLILLEALLALVLLALIVWWTMFSGRKGGEPPSATDDDPKP